MNNNNFNIQKIITLPLKKNLNSPKATQPTIKKLQEKSLDKIKKKNGKIEQPNIENKTSKLLLSKSITSKKNKQEKLKKASNKQPESIVKDTYKGKTVNITFQLRFHTELGQTLFVTGNHLLLGNNNVEKALPMKYFNQDFWYVNIELPVEDIVTHSITYNYLLQEKDGSFNMDYGRDKVLDKKIIQQPEIHIIDSWNHPGYVENVFYTEPFKNILLKNNFTPIKIIIPKINTHIFKIKAPLLKKGEVLCILGGDKMLSNWDETAPYLLQRENEEEAFWWVRLNLSEANFPIEYKYGVYNTIEKKLVYYEEGDNRIVHEPGNKKKLVVLNDGFAMFTNVSWKGAGIAIPVFSLRSKKSLGVGEFTDIKLLIDWANETGLKLIQLLPVNDTIATHTWADSYPYAAISAFALHPLYLNLFEVIDKKDKNIVDKLKQERERLNALDTVDYEAVMQCKLSVLKQIYITQSNKAFKTSGYKKFFEENKHWLQPYAIFSYLRDRFHTADFNQWSEYSNFSSPVVSALADENSKMYNDIAFYYFIQYHLHIQLKDATVYAHKNGIIVKGDIPIGVYRFGCDAWQQPELYHMDLQAGAPPDDFAIKGQNWGFPTYNWTKMNEDGFKWWKRRFEQMSCYFDAFRIDHILGFFRIWSIPLHAVEGIMGRFVPAIPVHVNEFSYHNIYFDYNRYCKPFINNQILWETFGDKQEYIQSTFLEYDDFGNYLLKPEFNTQKKVEQYFLTTETEANHQFIKQGLFDLISNVILFEEEDSQAQRFHFRFAIETTSSFRYLDITTQHQLRNLYIDYFFHRQEEFWKQEAVNKLPALKRVTNMLVCGEDLGLVPHCVPEVMKELGILSLEIQRMPKNGNKQFFHPADAPYLSVITPSTHDMSTIRGWWEENHLKTQQFYNQELGQRGEAPYFCEPWIAKAINLQHLASPAMWSIFQMQDLLAMNENLRQENPQTERINEPSNPKHYWRYRIPIMLENLLQEDEFNQTLRRQIQNTGRV